MTNDGERASFNLDRAPAVFAASLIYTATMTIPNVMPALLGLFAEHGKLGGTQLGLVGAMYSLGLGVAAVTSYLWVRWVNWRICMLVGLVLMGTATGLQALSNDFVQLLFLMLAAGCGGGLAASPSLAALGDSRDPQRNFGVMIFMSTTVPAIVIAAVPKATSVLGYAGAFVVLSAISIFSAMFIVCLPRSGKSQVPRPHDMDPSQMRDASRGTVTALASMFLFVAGYVAAWYFLERVGSRSGLPQAAMLDSLALGGLIGGLGGFVALLLRRILGARQSFALAIIITIASLLCLEMVKITVLSYFLVATSFQLSINVNFSNVMSLIAMNDEKGRFVAMIPGLQSFGATAGSILAGFAFEKEGRVGVISVSVIAFILCAGLVLRAFQVSHARTWADRITRTAV